jgi:tRNA-splicing endonuclease subunit Sen2
MGSQATESVINGEPQTPASVDIELVNQEHLQLSLDEAFFLSYALGSLHIARTGDIANNTWDILQLFRCHSYFPPLAPSTVLQPDDPFILHYAAYHHFRTLGWVVRSGVKFAVDYLLYERGVVFSHAAFSVLIIPSYSDPYWSSTPELTNRVKRELKKTSWHWFHCANRVQNQVLKTLVLCYVDVPGPERQAVALKERDVGKLLRSYKVREFATKRWSPNRNRE